MKAAEDAIAALSRLARELDREIARLREEHESFAELRRLVGRPTRQRRRRS